MKKIILFNLLINLCVFHIKAQVVYETEYIGLADTIIYISEYPGEIDLCVYQTQYIGEAISNYGCWYWTQYPGAADFSVYVTPYRGMADKVICFTDYFGLAGNSGGCVCSQDQSTPTSISNLDKIKLSNTYIIDNKVVSINSEQFLGAQILDMNGKEVINTSLTSFNIDNLSKGVYILSLTFQNENITDKIIVK